MSEKTYEKSMEIMKERFGHDNLISVATVYENKPYVRTVNTYYENSSFYVITYALSNKIKHIEKNPVVAISGDWFTAHGIGENMGHILLEKNSDIAAKLREAFSEWYSNGHTDESDPNTCILKIKLTEGVLFDHGTRYDIDFTNKKLK